MSKQRILQHDYDRVIKLVDVARGLGINISYHWLYVYWRINE